MIKLENDEKNFCYQIKADGKTTYQFDVKETLEDLTRSVNISNFVKIGDTIYSTHDIEFIKNCDD